MKSLIFCLMLAIIASCATSTKMYYSHHFYDAMLRAVKILQKHPNDSLERDILSRSYLPAIESLEGNVTAFAHSNGADKLPLLDDELKKINTLANEMSMSPAATSLVDGGMIYSLKRKAAELAYGKVSSNWPPSDYQGYMISYHLLRDIDLLTPGTNEITEKLKEAAKNARFCVSYSERSDSTGTDGNFTAVVKNTLAQPPMSVCEAGGDVQQTIELVIHGYTRDSSTVKYLNSSSTNLVNNNGVVTPNFTGSPNFEFRYTILVKYLVTLTIKDVKTQKILLKTQLEGRGQWVSSDYKYVYGNHSLSPDLLQWSYKSGSQGLNESDYLKRSREHYKSLYDQAHAALQKHLVEKLKHFYSKYDF